MKRNKQKGGAVDLFRKTATGSIIQKGGHFLQQALTEKPELQQFGYFNEAVHNWLNDPANQAEYLVFIQRKSGRVGIYMVDDLDSLVNTVLPGIYGEFHTRMECCALRAYVSPEAGEILRPYLGHKHPEFTREPVLPTVKQMTIPDYGRVVTVEIPKKLVERGEITGVLRTMDVLIATLDDIRKNSSSLMLLFDGYNNKSVEVFEHPEVRKFIRSIVANAPWWLLLAHPESYMTWFSSIVPHSILRKDGQGTVTVQFDPDGLKAAIQTNLSAITMLFLSVDADDEQTRNLIQPLTRSLSAFAGIDGDKA